MSLDLPAYEETRPSQLRWLNRLPSHWKEHRAKLYFREVDERSSEGAEEVLSVSHLTGVTPRSEKNVTMFQPESYAGHKLCRPGDVVINTMWAWAGALGVARRLGVVSPAYGVYRPIGNDFVPAYLDRLLRSDPFISEYLVRSTGIRASRLRLYPDRFLTIPFACPPIAEQEKMASYLEAKESQIDELMAAKRLLIELLHEQKRTIETRLLAAGTHTDLVLGPEEWMGMIPRHWEIRRLKYLVKNVNDVVVSKEADDIYVALENIESWTGRLFLEDLGEDFESNVKQFRTGDVLFGKLRPYLAKVTLAKEDGVCVSELLVLRPQSLKVLPEFLEAKLRSVQVIDYVNSSTFGAKMPRAEWSFIGNLLIAYPNTTAEQDQLLSTIKAETGDIDRAVEQARREIELMKEYKARLLSDVVTGRVDVRSLAQSGETFSEPSFSDEGLMHVSK